ncbi:MAG: beta-lactamase family protein [Dyadobacter sp.]|uniref:serine hydrolase domain-containing protein n=1 Tax=Dyadobacter sp. TaxID=1914288 RepID=UPI001B0F3950|nr:serine hydrolase domain-containing protein [Dyadobacter sp.]MBO9611824.1 beta-lactamase family protein [Dyadobacter sp.]
MTTRFLSALLVLLVVYCPIFAQDEVLYRIDRLFSVQFKAGEPGANILIAKSGKIIYQKAFGMANMELGVPSDTATVYYIASNTKQFTAVAILQLVEKRMISLDDTLGKFVKSVAPASGITIRQLLSHTSGLNGNGYRDSLNIPEGKTVQAETERYAARNVAFAPGSKWAYNNANFQVLGHIIEKLSGKTYAEYIRENIFVPAGMNASLVATSDEPIVKGRASGYGILRKGIVNYPLHDISEFFASGGILTTASDMLRWNRALVSGKLLPKNLLELAFTPIRLNNGLIAPYGFGWYVDDLRGSTVLRHGGAVPGFISETFYLPEKDIYIVILINSESAVIPQVLARIAASELLGKPYRFDGGMTMDGKNVGKYAGVYESDRAERVNITEENGKVYWQRIGGKKYEVMPFVIDEFYFEKDFLWLEFKRDEKKKITSLVFSRAGYTPSNWKRLAGPVMHLSETGQEVK